MATLADRFVGDVFKKFGLFAPWLPNVPVSLGAVGVLEGGVFVPKTTLANLGVVWRPAAIRSAGIIDHASDNGVDLRMKASGSAITGSSLALAEAGATVSFRKTGAVVLQASGVKVRRIATDGKFEQAILERFEKGLWNKDWVFINEVHEAASTTVIISEGKAAQLELKATGRIPEVVPLSGEFVIASKTGSVTVFLGEKGFTPLFKLSRVTHSWLKALLGSKTPTKVTGARRAVGARERPVKPRPSEPVLEQVMLPSKRTRRA